MRNCRRAGLKPRTPKRPTDRKALSVATRHQKDHGIESMPWLPQTGGEDTAATKATGNEHKGKHSDC